MLHRTEQEKHGCGDKQKTAEDRNEVRTSGVYTAHFRTDLEPGFTTLTGKIHMGNGQGSYACFMLGMRDDSKYSVFFGNFKIQLMRLNVFTDQSVFYLFNRH